MANILALVTFSIYPAQMGGQKGELPFFINTWPNIAAKAAKEIDNVQNQNG